MYVKPEAAITVFELLMISGVSLEIYWAIKKHCNNKVYYTVASCWLFLQDLFYEYITDRPSMELRSPYLVLFWECYSRRKEFKIRRGQWTDRSEEGISSTRILKQECTNTGRKFGQETKFCKLVPNIFGRQNETRCVSTFSRPKLWGDCWTFEKFRYCCVQETPFKDVNCM